MSLTSDSPSYLRRTCNACPFVVLSHTVQVSECKKYFLLSEVCFCVVLSESRWKNVVENFVNVSIRPVSCERTIYRKMEEYHIIGSAFDKYRVYTEEWFGFKS